MDFSTFTVPVLIFVAEVCALTVSTLRIIFVARGHKFLAPLLGFFEILIWLFAIGETMRNLDNWACFIAFALGFTLGNYFGILIDQWLALGNAMVRVITHRNAAALVEGLRAASFGVTSVEGYGANGKVQILMTVVKCKQLSEVVGLIETHHAGAFYAVEDLRSACDGVFPAAKERPSLFPLPIFKVMRSMMPQKQPKLAAQCHGQADGGAGEAGEPEAAALH